MDELQDRYTRNTMKFVSLVAMSAFVLFGYVTYASGLSAINAIRDDIERSNTVALRTETPQVLGVDTSPQEKLTEKNSSLSGVEVKINNTEPGRAAVELYLPEEDIIGGAQLIFDVESSLDITGVECDFSYICLTSKYDPQNSTIELYFVEDPSLADSSVEKDVYTVGYINYNPTTVGELILDNTEGAMYESRVVSRGSSVNLLEPEIYYFGIGGR